jgi:hypothetical protein
MGVVLFGRAGRGEEPLDHSGPDLAAKRLNQLSEASSTRPGRNVAEGAEIADH